MRTSLGRPVERLKESPWTSEPRLDDEGFTARGDAVAKLLTEAGVKIDRRDAHRKRWPVLTAGAATPVLSCPGGRPARSRPQLSFGRAVAGAGPGPCGACHRPCPAAGSCGESLEGNSAIKVRAAPPVAWHSRCVEPGSLLSHQQGQRLGVVGGGPNRPRPRLCFRPW